MAEYKPTIGVEVHAQVMTETKLFCGCPVVFREEPNSSVCPICLGLPGVLPVLNQKGVELAIKAALSLNCDINNYSTFARKNYFYPDLPRGYQITQYRYPLAENGSLKVGGKTVRIKRLHLEEESARLVHRGEESLVDYNRAGIPLIEIVTEPDIESPEMAVDYLKKLQSILQFAEISEAVMAKGQFRCEPNISLSAVEGKLGTRTEVKNLNSFKAVRKSLDAEMKRQEDILKEGGEIIQETIHYNEDTGEIRVARTKEEASDYRYFPEPDLPPLKVSDEWILEVKENLPELPEKKKERYEKMGLEEEDAAIIANSRKAASLFDKTVEILGEPVEISRWIVREYRSFNEPDISPEQMAELLEMVFNDTISNNAGSEVFEEMVNTGKSAAKIVEEKNLKQISDRETLVEIVEEVFEENPEEFERLEKGEMKLVGFFVGKVMQKTEGKANPSEVSRIISKYGKEH